MIPLPVNISKADKAQVRAAFVMFMVKSIHSCVDMAKNFNFMFKAHRQISSF
jgi:hypothetical protein